MDQARFIQIEEDVPHPPGTNGVGFQRKQFFAERVGWIAMGLILLWALVGGFGDGWLSDRRASNAAGTCAVEYQRFGRRDAPFELRVLHKLNAPRGQVSLHLSRQFIDRVSLQRVTPMYVAMELDAQGVTLQFAVEPEIGEREFTIEYKPKHVGSLRANVRAAGEDAIAFQQFIYP